MTPPRTPDQIRRDIAATREELADAAAALAYKADVKARAKERVSGRVHQIKDRTPDSVGSAATGATTKVRQNPVPTAAIAAALIGFALGYLIAHRTGD